MNCPGAAWKIYENKATAEQASQALGHALHLTMQLTATGGKFGQFWCR